MTGCSQKQAERSVLERLLSTEGITPEMPPQKGETPDFMMKVSGQSIGVEVTTYQSGKTVAIPGKGRRSRRANEAEWEHLKCLSHSFRTSHPTLKNIGIILWFKNLVPSRNEANDFLVEINDFICAKHNELRQTFTVYSSYQFTSSPLMRKYIRDIGINVHDDAEWDSNMASGGFVDPPAAIISDIVKLKTVNKKRQTVSYRNADELWLIIDSSGRNSETNLPIKGVKEFYDHKFLNENLENSPFARVYTFTAMGLFSWHRGRGWQGPSTSNE
jgi:hypothetical protein